MKRSRIRHFPIKLFYALLSFFLLGTLLLAVVYIKQVQELRSEASYSEINLVQNPSFDDWNKGLPKLWRGNKNFVAQSQDRADGSSAVTVKGVTDVYQLRNEIRQDLTNPDKTKLYDQNSNTSTLKSFSANSIINFIQKSGTTKSLLELGQYTPGQIAQVVVGIRRNKDYTLTFLTNGGRGQAVIEYTYKETASSLKFPDFIKKTYAVSPVDIKVAVPLNRKHAVSKAFGPNSSYTQVTINFHTHQGLKNGTATLTFMALPQETVLIDNVVLKETAN
ncbi:MAG: hypothetical protein ACD_12C00525G0001 [uncultured bacterium]|nr:MAG: hypothetical protein ACD_12C00525G0001 [uncultured bacterium]